MQSVVLNICEQSCHWSVEKYGTIMHGRSILCVRCSNRIMSGTSNIFIGSSCQLLLLPWCLYHNVVEWVWCNSWCSWRNVPYLCGKIINLHDYNKLANIIRTVRSDLLQNKANFQQIIQEMCTEIIFFPYCLNIMPSWWSPICASTCGIEVQSEE